jgi:hypothetical protein
MEISGKHFGKDDKRQIISREPAKEKPYNGPGNPSGNPPASESGKTPFGNISWRERKQALVRPCRNSSRMALLSPDKTPNKRMA